MGNAAGVKSKHSVVLVASELGGVPGCKAYHTSLLIGGTEFFFTPGGIDTSSNLDSHGARPIQRVELGSTSVPTAALHERLGPHFAPGSYDLLRKNCNSFSDAALVVLLDRRLDQRYRQLEKIGARFPQLLHRLTGGDYTPNPEATNFDLDQLCSNLRFGPDWADRGHTVDGEQVGRNQAPARSENAGRRKKDRQPLVRAHVLPFRDAFELNFDYMARAYVLPYVMSPEVSDPATGRGLRQGDEFSGNGGRARFRVVACEPPEGGLPDSSTIVMCEGEPIERTLLRSVTMLPLETSMVLLVGKDPSDLAREFVRPFLEQRSADLVVGQIHNLQGVRFKVVGTQPAAGGGPCIETQINTRGPPVKLCTVEGCEASIAKQCREKDCRRWVCMRHAASIVETSCLCPDHAPKARGLFGMKRG